MLRLRAPMSRAFVDVWRVVTRARSKAFSLLASGSFRSFGSRPVLQGPLRLSGEGRMVIGSDVFVGSGSWLQVLDPEGSEVAIEIGDANAVVTEDVPDYSLAVGAPARTVRSFAPSMELAS